MNVSNFDGTADFFWNSLGDEKLSCLSAQTWANLGKCLFFSLDRKKEGITSIKKSYDIYENINPLSFATAESKIILSNMYFAFKDYENALFYSKEALSIYSLSSTGVRGPYLRKYFLSIGYIFQEMGHNLKKQLMPI